MNKKLLSLTLSALFCALTFVATRLSMPTPIAQGYVHLGDVAILLCAVFLPTPYAACSAAIGGAFADIISGFAIYSPFTAVIKALLTVLFSCKGKIFTAKNFIALGMSVVITVVGYFVTDSILFGAAAGFASLPFNLLQGVASALIFIVICLPLDKYKVKKNIFKGDL